MLEDFNQNDAGSERKDKHFLCSEKEEESFPRRAAEDVSRSLFGNESEEVRRADTMRVGRTRGYRRHFPR
jgi:hypothetical protein